MRNIYPTSETVLSRRIEPQLTLGKVILTILLAVLMVILSIVVDFSVPPPPWRQPAAGAVIGMILVMSGFRIGQISLKALIVLFFWFGYSITGVVAALINNDNLGGELWQLIGVPLAIFLIVPNYAKKTGSLIVALATIFGIAPFIIISLLLYPIEPGYTGVYNNPNAMGLISITWIAGLLIPIRKYLADSRKSFLKLTLLTLLIVTFIVAVILLVASNSRTSLISFVMLVSITALTLIDTTRKRFWVVSTVVGFILILSAMLVTAGIYQGDIFSEHLKKFELGLGLFSGRELIWRNILDNSSWFGHGSSALLNRIPGNPAHNTHLEVLDARGIVGLIFRLLFDISAIVVTYRLAKRRLKEDGFALGPFLLVMNYIVLGLAENVNGTLGSAIHMAYLLMIGVAINYDQFH